MNDLLYDRKVTEVRDYTCQINSGGAMSIRERGLVEIRFVDKKFSAVIACPVLTDGSPTRNGWRILAAIEEEIARIEASFPQPGVAAPPPPAK